jgi:putative membrane protein
MMYGYENGWGANGWVLMSVLILAVTGAMIVSVLALIRTARPLLPAQAGQSSALRILDERFARGEIDESEYAARRDRLTT